MLVQNFSKVKDNGSIRAICHFQIVNIKQREATDRCLRSHGKCSIPHPIELHCNEQLKVHKGKDLNCKMLSVMMKHLNILKYFSFGIESLWT